MKKIVLALVVIGLMCPVFAKMSTDRFYATKSISIGKTTYSGTDVLQVSGNVSANGTLKVGSNVTVNGTTALIGAVGVGVTQTTFPLVVAFPNDGLKEEIILHNNLPFSGGSANESASLVFTWNDSGNGMANGSDIIGGKLFDYSSVPNAQSYLAFRTALDNTTTEKVRITNTGNVGIGTTIPITKLEVAGGSISGNAVILGSASITTPSAIEGTIWYNKTDKKLKIYDGTSWNNAY